MNERVLTPRNRGFLFLDSHPEGCRQSVADMWRACPDPADPPQGPGPVALVIGSSAGYGLAATLAGLKRAGIRGIAVSFEKAPTERRTATAGWYRTAATADVARAAGRDLVFLNGDAFSDTMKDHVADLVERRFGGRLDHLIYSVAAPAAPTPTPAPPTPPSSSPSGGRTAPRPSSSTTRAFPRSARSRPDRPSRTTSSRPWP